MSRSHDKKAPTAAYTPYPVAMTGAGEDHTRDRWTEQCSTTFWACLRLQSWFLMPVFLIQAVVVFCLGVIHTADASVTIYTQGVQHGTRVTPVYVVSWAFFGSFVSGFLLCIYPTTYEHQLRLRHSKWRHATDAWAHAWLVMLAGLLTGTDNLATLVAIVGLSVFISYASALEDEDDQHWWMTLCGWISTWTALGVSFISLYHDLSPTQRTLFGTAASLQLLRIVGPVLYVHRRAVCSMTSDTRVDDLRFLRGELLSLVLSAITQTVIGWQVVNLLFT